MIVFVCDNNACHSIMAQAVFEYLKPNILVQSAGQYASFVRAEVRAVLDEEGIVSKGLHSKAIAAVDWDDVELVVVLCAEDIAPFTPSRIPKLHWWLPDPLGAPESERMEACRALRDELLRRIELLISERDI